jgi:hypothetical protein
MVGYVQESLFLYRTYTGSRGLPQKNVFEVLPVSDVQAIELGQLGPAPVTRPWFNSLASYTADLINLCLLCRAVNPRVVFEIGTMNGYTALHFALNSPPDARVYTLDLPNDGSQMPQLPTTLIDDLHIDGHESYRRYSFENNAAESKITCLFGDSATFDYSPYEKRVDLFFIDGSHSYEYVRSDTLNGLNCCHPGSVIAWHDFGRVGVNGVSRFLMEFSRRAPVYAVPGGSLAFSVVT